MQEQLAAVVGSVLVGVKRRWTEEKIEDSDRRV